MYGSPKASQEYLRNAVMTASPEQLHIMLLDGAIRFAIRGQQAVQAADHEAAFQAFDRAQRIVMQLRAGLNREVAPELVDQMHSLYNFIFRRLVDGHIHRDPAAVDDALRILRHQRETWAQLLEKLAKERGASQAPADGKTSLNVSG